MLLVFSPGLDPIHHPWLHEIIYGILATLFAALLFWSIDARSLWGIPKGFYEIRALRAIGKYSYGIYIFHLPLMYLARFLMERMGVFKLDADNWGAVAVLIPIHAGASFGLAFLSFHLFEKHFLKLKRYFPVSTSGRR